MGVTDDRNDPALTHGSDDHPVPMADKYLVLSDRERSKGFVRPLHSIDILAIVQLRLEAHGALEELHTFHRLSPDELTILVHQEAHDTPQEPTS